MALKDYKFVDGDFINQGISDLPDRPSQAGISAAQLKARFDNIPKIIMALGKINSLIDYLAAAGEYRLTPKGRLDSPSMLPASSGKYGDYYYCKTADPTVYDMYVWVSAVPDKWDLYGQVSQYTLDQIDAKFAALESSINSKLDKTASPNRNLLHNWDFRSPVNQRGQSNYNHNSLIGYSIDRWKLTYSSLNIMPDGIGLSSVNAGAYNFLQHIELPIKYAGKTVTLSLKLKSVNGAVRFGIRANDADFAGSYADASTPGVSKLTCTIPSVALSSLFIFLIPQTVGAESVLESAKLELGSVSTLANDPPADYGEQLTLCQRFGLPIAPNIRIRSSQYSTNTIDFLIPIPVTLRVAPTISVTPQVESTAGVAQTGFTFAVQALSAGYLIIRATKTSHGLTDAVLNFASGSFLSADL